MADSKYFGVPFATSGDKATIPEATQPSGSISFTQGFGPDYERDPATDPLAKRVPRDETNELNFQMTNAIKFLQLYGTPEWYAVDDLGNPVSYPLSARVRYDAGAGMQAWRSIAAANTATPGSDATKWALDTAFDLAALEATLAEAISGLLGTKIVTPRRLASSVQQGKWNYGAAAGTASALTLTLSPAPANVAAITGAIILVKILATNTGAATLDVNGTGALPVQRLDGSALGAGDLPAARYVALTCTGSSYTLLSSGYQEVRRRLTGNTSFYVNGSTGNDNNDGLSSGSAWATLTKVASYLSTQVDLNGFTVTVNVANGTYTAGFSLGSMLPGQSSPNQVKLIGNNANPISCFVNVATGAAFQAGGGGGFSVEGFQVAGPSPIAGAGLYAASGGVILFQNIFFNVAGVAQLFAEVGGFLRTSGGYTINNSAPSHIKAQDGGVVSIVGVNISVVGTPAFPTAFAYSYTGVINAPASLYSGGATGPRYYVDMNGAIKTNGAGANFFPGSIAGAVNAGGQYQ